MKLYTRNKILYFRLNGRRVSSRLVDTPQNRKKLLSYYKDNDFMQRFNLLKVVPTLKDLVIQVLKEKEIYLKSTSYLTYEALFNTRILPFFKELKVNEIMRKDILKFYNTFTDKSTLNICSTLLKSAFEIAIIEEYINFIPLVKKPVLRSNFSINPFNLNEIDLILSKCEYLTLKNVLGLGFFSGLRIGEIIGLKWSDIDFLNYTISINRTVTSGFMHSPKTKASVRVIDMLPQSEYFLKFQRLSTGLKTYIFYSPRGNRFNRSLDFYLKWKKLLLDCELDYRNIYQVRHSFASNMLSNGESLTWVSHTLGHKSPFITLQKYSRYIISKSEKRKQTFLDSGSNMAHSSISSDVVGNVY